MTRGSKTDYQQEISKNKTKTRVRTVQLKRNVKKTKKSKKDKQSKKSSKKEGKESKKNVVERDASEVCAASIRRNEAGRFAVGVTMQKLYDLDCKQFPRRPCFDRQGSCRMKFDGASQCTWAQMLDISPKVLEAMQFGRFGFSAGRWQIIVDHE